MCSRGMRGLREDRISSLPDEILLLIMSLLPFKEVVKTSLLSRRWLNLWVHTPVLHFDDALVAERRNYVTWVNRVLGQHKGQYLKEFRLACDLGGCNKKDIDSWLVFALAKKVECLELDLFSDGHYECKRKDCGYALPGPFLGFGSGNANSVGLKSLSLKSVEVTGEDVNLVLGNCPFLERLEVLFSSKLVSLVISDPTLVLKYLKINYCYHLKVLSISNLNLVSLDISSDGDLTLTDLPMLVELFIAGFAEASRSLTRSISQASSCFSQLEAFTLTGSCLKDATLISDYDQLTKLKRLVIIVEAMGDESPYKLISTVNACPRLEEFVFMLRGWFKPENQTRRRNTTCKAEILRGSSFKSKSLKVFEFVGYHGLGTDDELIMRVVENAVTSLEKIIIDPRDPPFIGGCGARDTSMTRREEEARSNALQLFDCLRKCVPPHIRLLLR